MSNNSTSREVRCGSCGALNRIGRYSVALLPKCGKCRATLPESGARRSARFLYRNRGWGPLAGVMLCLAGVSAWRQLSTEIKPVGSETRPPKSDVAQIGPEAHIQSNDRRSMVTQGPIPICRTPPVNGQIIGDYRGVLRRGHTLIIDNGSIGNAIIKVRDGETGRLVVSFYVAVNSTASVGNLADGRYRTQYALGGDLAINCKTFVRRVATKESRSVDDADFDAE
jgi:hypothetical protein